MKSRNPVPAAATLLFLGIAFFPFLWVVLTSIKPPGEIFASPLQWLPSRIDLDAYRNVFTTRPFGYYLWNSFRVASLTTVVCLLFGSLAAYAVVRLGLPAGKAFLLFLLSIAMFPQIAVVSPLFLFLRKLRLLNTWIGLTIPYLTFALPLTVWFLSCYFREIPKELDEAARVDGCSPLRALFHVTLPVAAPAVASTALLTFIFCWNEFLFALVYTIDRSARTATVGIALFSARYEIPWGEICAATVVVTLPLLVLVLFLQKRIVSGLTSGSLKG